MSIMRIVHVIVGLVGFWLVYLTFAMKESTEGVWINRIESFWIDLDDRKKTIGDTTKALFRKLADKVSRGFNQVFGASLISVRAVGISGSLSFASFFLVLGVLIEGLCYFVAVNAKDIKPEVLHQIPLIFFGLLLLLIAGLCLLLALLPIFFRLQLWAWLSCIPTSLTLFFAYEVIHKHLGNTRLYGIFLAFAISFASDLLLLILVRRSLRWILAGTTLARIIGAVEMQVVSLFLIFVVPYRLPIVWRPEMAKTSVGLTLFLLAVFNLPTVLASAAFGFSLFVVLAHRLIWPFLSDLTYILTRNEVLEKRKTVRWIGWACILYAFSPNQTFWYYLAQKVLK